MLMQREGDWTVGSGASQVLLLDFGAGAGADHVLGFFAARKVYFILINYLMLSLGQVLYIIYYF